MATDAFEIIVDRDAVMTTSDGVRLAATIYRAANAAPSPALLMRTPYGKDGGAAIHVIDPSAAVRAGFCAIIQDVRGRFASEGVWRPYETEAVDGAEAVQWAASLPFCNGSVGMYGSSYQGAVLLAAAAMRPPALQSIAPMMCWRDPQQGQSFRGGALELGKLLRWTMMNMPDRLQRRIADPEQARQAVEACQADLAALDAHAYSALPLDQQPVLKRYDAESEIFDYMHAADRGDFDHPPMVPPGRWHDVPALWVAGWFDSFLGDMLRAYQADLDLGLASELIITPWTHAVHTGAAGLVDFGPDSRRIGVRQTPLGEVLLQWFDDTLRGARTPQAPRVFAMGPNVWTEPPVFPPPNAVEDIYLTAEGSLAQQPGNQSMASFDYDPDDPAPSIGGPTLMGSFFPAGPADQSVLSARKDVLLFQGPCLERDLALTGWLSAELWVESSAPCTDFVARVVDIGPDGRQLGVTDGIVRLQLDPAGGPQRAVIDLWATDYTLARGHRLGLQVTSSSFPRWNRNLNSGEPLSTGVTPQVARQAIHLGGARASRLRIGQPLSTAAGG